MGDDEPHTRNTDANGSQRAGLDNNRRDLTPDQPRDDGPDERELVDDEMATGSGIHLHRGGPTGAAVSDLTGPELALDDDGAGPTTADGGLPDHPTHDVDPDQDAEPDDYEMMLDMDDRDAPLSPERIAAGLIETPRRGRDDALGHEPDDIEDV